MISLIWAMDEQRLIGANNQMPWHLPADMQWFRQHTTAKNILMGRKTFASLGKPLPKRHNIILSRQQGLHIEGCEVITDIQDIISRFSDSDDELMVIGGAEIYALMLPFSQRLYCTHVLHQFQGDTWFPDFEMSDWQRTQQQKFSRDDKNPYAYRFEVYDHV
ncbi:MAG: dihydrofolate reductase [Mariprofundaceae bacterium]|nr:dihydrofolate reductase [Mariprofundaceae bacterium]